MSSLKALKGAKTLKEFAALLDYKPSSLSFVLYQTPKEKRYLKFQIPKKNGGAREICAPINQLKLIQRKLADYLEKCRQEIESSGKSIYSVSHGYRSGYSIVTNARQHRNRRYVLNLDIENFFPSFNFGRVRGFFIKNEDFSLDPKIATIIAQIACHENALPQGSPCSPIISDLMARILDIRLVQLARRHKCTYSRYVDDLTFSTGKRSFPPGIAYQISGNESFWAAGGELLRDISRLGFSLNHVKTRMQYRSSRQMVTGLVVNKKINTSADYYRAARAMCQSLFTTGTFQKPVASYTRQKKAGADKKEPVTSNEKKPPTVNQLAGILSHIQFIHDEEKKRTQSPDQKPLSNKKVTPRGLHKLHKRFLFFKYFVALERPLVVCEGKTDSIYLKSAMSRVHSAKEKFLVEEGGKFKNKISYFNYNNLTHKILQLTGGADPLRDLIANYDECADYYKYAPLSHPVIVLIDNDNGAEGICKLLSAKGIDCSLTSTNAFYRITKNLYLVKTPEKGEKGISCIEDLFDSDLLKKEIEGKKFNLKKEHGSPTEFGKAIFAEKIILPNANKIDFSKFEELFLRIEAAISDYAAIRFREQSEIGITPSSAIRRL